MARHSVYYDGMTREEALAAWNRWKFQLPKDVICNPDKPVLITKDGIVPYLAPPKRIRRVEVVRPAFQTQPTSPRWSQLLLRFSRWFFRERYPPVVSNVSEVPSFTEIEAADELPHLF